MAAALPEFAVDGGITTGSWLQADGSGLVLPALLRALNHAHCKLVDTHTDTFATITIPSHSGGVPSLMA